MGPLSAIAVLFIVMSIGAIVLVVYTLWKFK